MRLSILPYHVTILFPQKISRILPPLIQSNIINIRVFDSHFLNFLASCLFPPPMRVCNSYKHFLFQRASFWLHQREMTDALHWLPIRGSQQKRLFTRPCPDRPLFNLEHVDHIRAQHQIVLY